MFDRDPELSPDLVWLLQSQQVEDDLLARLLVQEYYAQLQSFWEALLGDAQEARRATQETLSTALIKANTYHETQSVRSWLTGLAIELYRKDHQKLTQGRKPAKTEGLQLGRFSHSSRLAVVLRFRLDYTPEEVAGFLRESLFSTKIRLWDARQLLLRQISNSNRPSGYQAEGDPLAQAFQRAYPTPALSEVDLELISQGIIERARRMRRRLQRAAYWKEFSLISAVILVVLMWMARARPEAPQATPKSPTGIALVGAPARPTRRPTATPSPQPTGTPYAWAGISRAMPTQWTPTPIPENAFYTVQEGDTLGRIAMNMGVSVEVLRSLNRLPQGAILQPGLRLLKPGLLTFDTPAPGSAPFETQPTPTPLSGPPSPDEILGRWENFPVNSLWIDVHLIYRGPQGYLGEAQTLRMQIWATSDGELITTGPDQAAPDTVFTVIKVKFSQQGVIYVANPDIGNPWFVRSSSEVEIYQYYSLLSDILNIQPYHWGDQLVHTVLVGSGNVGDRPAYILKQFDLQQRPLRTIWVDQVSGLPLHIQVHDLHNPQRITTETLVTGLQINADIPQALFNPQIPWLGGYAKDSSGAPFAPGEGQSPWVITPPPRINQPYIPAPANLNMATSPLQFQFRDAFSIFSGLDPADLYQAEIFTGGRYLGLARLPNPFFTLCARSPDGWRMAYDAAGTNIPDIYTGGIPGSFIRWIDLSDPETEHMPVANLQPFSFAFSPDGEHLAVYGEDFDNQRGIYLVDLQNEEVRLLQGVDFATSLVWKPDGKQLAYISRPADSQSSFSLVVLDMESGEVVSRQSFPAPGDPPAQNGRTWPPLKWGVPFPVEMGDLGACAAPPAGK
jgi:hypothetical protein